MKKLLLIGCLALLVSCSSGRKVLSYHVTFPRTDNPDRMAALTLASRNVMERRLVRLEGDLIDYDIEHDEEENYTEVSVEIENTKAAKKLNSEMLAPFDFAFRVKADTFQEGDIDVEGVGAFRSIGVGKEDVDWVIGETMEGPLKKGRVIIGFTDEGMEKAKEEFPKHTGKTVGLFVRGQLTATIKLSDKEIGRTVVIQGLPSGEIAKVFADDMNVGIHMTFEKL